jgi:hypothetical protein
MDFGIGDDTWRAGARPRIFACQDMRGCQRSIDPIAGRRSRNGPGVVRVPPSPPPWLAPGGCATFHDYADYFPGVVALADEPVASGRNRVAGWAKSLIVLRRPAAGGPSVDRGPGA